jgi:WXG100 family type VII secretion target
MTAPQVRSDYDQLTSLAQSFRAQADNVAKTNQQVKANMETLQSGGWIGQGATAFYKEMNDQVMPSMQRLNKALAEAGRITAEISRLMKEAEDGAAGCFHV